MLLAGMTQSASLVQIEPKRVLQCEAKTIRECVVAAKARMQ
jgi:hypothetical protein